MKFERTESKRGHAAVQSRDKDTVVKPKRATAMVRVRTCSASHSNLGAKLSATWIYRKGETRSWPMTTC